MKSLYFDHHGPVHFEDHGGKGRPIVLVHGLGGSTLNWMAVAPDLTSHGHVYAIDLAGFGRTPLGTRRATIPTNQALIAHFIREVTGGPALLIGNSMGGMLAIRVAESHPERVAGLVLVDPALPAPGNARFDTQVWVFFGALAVPGVARLYLRRRAQVLGPEGIVQQTLDLVTVDSRRVPPEVVRAHVELMTERFGSAASDRAFLDATRSLLAVMARRRAYHEVVAAVKAPALLIHGARDRLVPLAAAQAIATRRPDWTFKVLPDIGHVPMMEDPAGFLRVVKGWLSSANLAEAV